MQQRHASCFFFSSPSFIASIVVLKDKTIFALGHHGWQLIAATRTWAGCCCWCGAGAVPDWCASAPPTCSHRSQSQLVRTQLARCFAVRRVSSIKSHCHDCSAHACVSAAGVHVCGFATHGGVNDPCRPACSHVRDVPCDTCDVVVAPHARHAACARRLHGGCMFLVDD